MFLWQNLIVVGAALLAAALALLATTRDGREQQWFKLLLIGSLAAMLILMAAVPYGLSMVILMAILATLIARGIPPFSAYLAITALTPFLGYYAGGLAGIKTLLFISSPLVLGTTVILMRLGAPHRFVRARFQTADFVVIVFLVLNWYLLTRGANATSSLRALIEILLTVGAGYFVASRARMASELFVLKTFAFLGVALALVAIVEALMVWPQFSYVPALKGIARFGGAALRGNIMRAFGPFSDPLSLSMFLSACFIAVWGLWLTRLSHMLTAAIGLVILAGLVATVARTGGVALLAGIATFMLLRKHYSQMVGIFALGGAGVFLNSFLSEEMREASSGYRLQLAPAIWNAIKDRPLTGDNLAMEAGKLETLRLGHGIVDIVNSYLGFALEGGFLLLTAFVAIPVSAFLTYRRVLKRKPSSDQILLMQVALSQMAAYLGGLISASTADKNLIYVIALAGLVTGVQLNLARARHPRGSAAAAPALVATPARAVALSDLRG